VIAQGDAPATVSPVVVTAARTDQFLADTLPHTTAITEREIRESQAVDLLSLLQREAGLEIVRSGGIGSLSGVFMRGADPRQTLLLIDGQRVDAATAGYAAFDQIMLDEVERIEIVRGNVSSLYGSGAVGGVIQVFTRRGRGPVTANALVEGGSRSTGRASLSVGGEAGAHRFNFTASGFTTDGFTALDPAIAPAANPDRDGYRNWSGTASWSVRLAADTEAGLRAFRSRGNIEYDSAFGLPTDRNEADNTVTNYSAWIATRPVDAWRTTLTVGNGIDESANFLNGAPDGSFRTENRQLSWQNEIAVAATQQLALGYERLGQRVASSTPYDGTRRDVDSVRAAWSGTAGPHQWQLAGRLDHYSDFGNADTWFGGYGFEITDAWKVTASVSNGFTAPTFNFLYYPGFGNPDLQPERSRSGEIGVRYATRSVLARLALFRTDYRDLIEGVPPSYLPQNVSRARVEGAEASASGQWRALEWRAAVTFQDPVNEVTGESLLRRARRFGSVSGTMVLSGWKVGAEVLASGPRPDRSLSDFSLIELPGYAVVNLLARWDFAERWYVAGRIENVFDKNYRQVDGYNAPPFGAFVSVGWRAR
jgi:vitamin B12 transporter